MANTRRLVGARSPLPFSADLGMFLFMWNGLEKVVPLLANVLCMLSTEHLIVVFICFQEDNIAITFKLAEYDIISLAFRRTMAAYSMP